MLITGSLFYLSFDAVLEQYFWRMIIVYTTLCNEEQ